jgi:hypothetical protein
MIGLGKKVCDERILRKAGSNVKSKQPAACGRMASLKRQPWNFYCRDGASSFLSLRNLMLHAGEGRIAVLSYR